MLSISRYMWRVLLAGLTKKLYNKETKNLQWLLCLSEELLT